MHGLLPPSAPPLRGQSARDTLSVPVKQHFQNQSAGSEAQCQQTINLKLRGQYEVLLNHILCRDWRESDKIRAKYSLK
jgi:hypothetical protein